MKLYHRSSEVQHVLPKDYVVISNWEALHASLR